MNTVDIEPVIQYYYNVLDTHKDEISPSIVRKVSGK